MDAQPSSKLPTLPLSRLTIDGHRSMPGPPPSHSSFSVPPSLSSRPFSPSSLSPQEQPHEPPRRSPAPSPPLQSSVTFGAPLASPFAPSPDPLASCAGGPRARDPLPHLAQVHRGGRTPGVPATPLDHTHTRVDHGLPAPSQRHDPPAQLRREPTQLARPSPSAPPTGPWPMPTHLSSTATSSFH